MLSKTIGILLVSLVATAGFAWLLASFCADEDIPASTPDQASVIGNVSIPEKAAESTVKAVNAYPKLSFEAPVEYTYANDGTNRVFVVEQAGRIRVVDNNPNTTSAPVFLDIRKKVAYGGEMGLLGLAFHPDFKQNGYFFVNYTKDSPRETVVSRFKVASANATQVDPVSEVVLFTFKQPYSNHNGGKLAFGPDGFLYVATGDGGSGGDPQNNGQNKRSWLGKILRIDVNSTQKGNYGIPKDNPFAGNKDGLREEIYAWGLRNPWRFSFDERGRLWTGDVGQNEIEEIDIVTKGGNYGWRIREANEPFNNRDPKPDETLIDPIHEYSHGADGNSVTGGVIYRGKANPSLRGKYIYGDFGSGRLWALSESGGRKTANQLLINRAGSISAFGEDQNNELFICDYGGKILKIVSE
ncbi:PQQ-dependent sugar dehydrogenase [Spirosoma montaniterrae]|uniref:Glucose sorbosone dehydrogenase n=1 Tax=Spirosoma montaniterrae TaxID=1178516 RepID=A0A1P9WVT1_9BACT|nr:PQQ-dependent sugar dehydrogenase [Spirosoma montaniterrae]AQG79495.1 glucose sorbosone dehydrogenase [Spirosoma montaniterrae]